MVFQDETGFTQHPRLGRGWARRGQRLRIPTTSQHRQRLNVSGWVAPLLGRMGLVHTAHGDRAGFLLVLRHLYRRLRHQTIWLFVDGARWHRGEPVDQFLRTHRRLHLVPLPPYQPGLNAQERLWRQLRYEATTNRWFEDLDGVWTTIRTTARSWSAHKIRRLCNLN